MTKKSIWKIDPQEKINKTRVLYTGAEKNILKLKERLKHLKTSDVYPTMSGEYDYQLFFYTTAANDISTIKAMAEEIFGNQLADVYEKAAPSKSKTVILSGIIALILLAVLYGGYTQYSKNLNLQEKLAELARIKNEERFIERDHFMPQMPAVETVEIEQQKESVEEEKSVVEIQSLPKEEVEESFEIIEEKKTETPKIQPAVSTQKVAGAMPVGRTLKIIYADVAQADASIIITPTRKCYVIDTGDKSKDGKRIIEILKENNIREIEILVLTHPHKDHIGGAQYILENFPVKKVWDAGKAATSRTYKKILETIKMKRIAYETPKRGKLAKWDPRIDIKVLHPAPNKDYANINNASIVIQLKYLNTSFLFMGDLEAEYEEELVKQFGGSLKVDGLKVGHHGSRTSSSEEFLKKTRPKYCFIQVGAGNKFGHPTPAILKRLSSFTRNIYRTDERGDIVVESDGSRIKITPQH